MTASPGFDRDALAYDAVAAQYERGRPGYPDAIVDRLVTRLGDRRTVVDLAAGTGKFTRALIARGLPVVAVEPVAAMAVAARSLGVPVARAMAGALPLATGSIDAVTVAQAFQWFTPDDVIEIARVLAPGAMLAIVANRAEPTGVWGEIDAVRSAARTRPRRTIDAPAVVAASGCFGPIVRDVEPWIRRVDPGTLRDHLGSLSWVAGLDETARADFDRSVDQVLERAGSRLDLAYSTEVLVASRSG